MEREIVLTKEQIAEISERVAASLDTEFAKDPKDIPVFIGVLKGSVNFMALLTSYIKTNVIIDYIQVSSYEGIASTGAVVLKKDVSEDIANRTVVIVEDIVETGYTLTYLRNYLQHKYHPKKVIIVTLFDKVVGRKTDFKPEYSGVTLESNKFLVGFGMDYNGLLRNVPYVYNLSTEEKAQIDELLSKK